MPPNKKPVAKEKLDQVKTWIELGLPETPKDIDPEALAKLEAHSNAMPDQPKPAASMVATAPVESKPGAGSKTTASDTVFAGQNGNPVTALAISPDGGTVAVAGQLQVVLFDVNKSEFAGVLPYPEGEIFVLRFTSDGKHLLAGGGTAAEAGNVVLWSMDTRKRAFVIGDEYDCILGADVSPDSKLVLFGGPERVLKMADLESGQLIAEMKKHTDWVTAASFSPEGLLYTTADRDGNAYVWETETREQLHTLRGHSKSITSIAWSATGDHCITSSEDGTVRVWNMHTGKPDHQWQAHKDGTLSLQVTKKNEVVTAGRDGFVRRWSIEGAAKGEMKTPSIPTRVVAASGSIVAGEWNGAVSKWKFDSGEMMVFEVPSAKTTTDESTLIAEVSGPEPITEFVAAKSSVATNTMPKPVATPEVASVDLPVDARLAKAKATLAEISRQLSGTTGTESDTTALLSALTNAAQIADRIKDPSAEVTEARVFLKAAIAKTRSAANSSDSRSSDASTLNLQKKFETAKLELSVAVAEANRMEAEYKAVQTEIKTLTTASNKLRTRYIGLAEQMKQLAELSAQVERQMRSNDSRSKSEPVAVQIAD